MHLDMRVNGTTLLTGLIGNPVAHTVSPVLQNSLFTAMGINGVYLPLKVSPGELGEAVRGLKAVGFCGFNVTIPYKNEVIGLADELSEEVELLGAANTIKIADGRLYAFNTDADGFVRAFEEQTGACFNGRRVCILGAGGTARALSVKIALEGAASVCIVNRTESKAVELASGVNRVMEQRGRAARTAFAAEAGSPEARRMLLECDILVNTTSAGMHPDVGGCPVESGLSFRDDQIVYDAIYNPAQTLLLKKAQACGCKTANGAGMLFYQGIRAFEIWTGRTVPKSILEDLAADFLNYLER
jgi:shikimate dehydrogenase